MANPEEFKKEIRGIISQDYNIEFLGNNCDKIISFLTESKATKIYQWISNVLKKEIQPIALSSKKSYKEWDINQLLVFRYPLRIDNISYRILFVKIKNSFYIEFHLGDHKYYDKVRRDLSLKKSSY